MNILLTYLHFFALMFAMAISIVMVDFIGYAITGKSIIFELDKYIMRRF